MQVFAEHVANNITFAIILSGPKTNNTTDIKKILKNDISVLLRSIYLIYLNIFKES